MAAILVISADVIPGKEDEFNKWYDEHHIPLYSGKMPFLQSVRRFYSKRSNPQFLAVYEFASFDDLKKSIVSEESKLAGEDADKQIGKLVKSFSSNAYFQTYPLQ